MKDITIKLKSTLEKINLIDDKNNKLLQLKKSQLLAIHEGLSKICSSIDMFHRFNDDDLEFILQVVEEACEPKNISQCVNDLTQISGMLEEKIKANKNLSKLFFCLSCTLVLIGLLALSILAIQPAIIIPVAITLVVVGTACTGLGGITGPDVQRVIHENNNDYVNLSTQIGLFRNTLRIEETLTPEQNQTSDLMVPN